MIDTASLRLAFVVVAVTMLLLFYYVTFRTTRSQYCAWWCIALVLFVSGSAAYLLDGTAQQWWANPLGSILLVSGTASAWAGARTLHATRPALWKLALAPAVVGVFAAMDDPGTNDWAGGTLYLLMISVVMGLTTFELWSLDRGTSDITTVVSGAAALASGFYFYRWIVYLSVGPDDPFFTTFAGSEMATLVNMVLLVTVSYSMTILGNNEATSELRRRATRDGLTGLLNRTEFLNRANAEIRHLRRTKVTATLIVADLDHFKAINDATGHQGGDQILQQFAAACESTIRSSDLIGRYGGDEFIIFLSTPDIDHAARITNEISSRLQMLSTAGSEVTPTVSFGIAAVNPNRDLNEAIAAADAALYQAKTVGGDGHVVAGTEIRDIA